jgi:hypothetical protein
MAFQVDLLTSWSISLCKGICFDKTVTDLIENYILTSSYNNQT